MGSASGCKRINRSTSASIRGIQDQCVGPSSLMVPALDFEVRQLQPHTDPRKRDDLQGIADYVSHLDPNGAVYAPLH